MKVARILLAGALLTAPWGWSSALGDRPRPAAVPRPDPDLVRRGDYLVNQVARCGDCHTPRDGRGRPDPARHLQGARMWFAPRVRAGEWEDHAPDITLSGKAGRWTEAKMIRLLTTGKEAEAPMPAYRLAPEDARAVAAYLRSVPGRKEGDRKEDERDRRRKGRDDD